MDEEDRYTRITLRIPKDLHRELSSAADATSKSLNAEIVGRLQASLDKERKRTQSTYASEFGNEGPPPSIYAELAIYAERRALSAELDRLSRLQDELWTVNSWREAHYGQNCAHHVGELEAGLIETVGELAEIEKEIEEARADADSAAKKAPELPGPWKRR